MRKIYFFLLFWIIHPNSLLAQFNSWVDYSRDYYKVYTAADGVYRLSQTSLSASGINVGEIDPRDIRMYHRGEEVSIFVAGEEDGDFGPQDYVEFVGKRNDGNLDRELYLEPDILPNPHYNTFSDSTAFFLTVTPGIRGKRMQVDDIPGGELETVSSYNKTVLQYYADQYSLGRTYFPNVRLSVYDEGQGWTSSIITRGNHRLFNFNGLGSVQAGSAPKVEIGIMGRSASSHLTSLQVGASPNNLRELGRYEFENFATENVVEELLPSDFNENGDLVIRVTSLGVEGAIDNVSVNYIRVAFETPVSGGDFDKRVFGFPAGVRALSINDISRNYVAYDITDIHHPTKKQLNSDQGNLEFRVGLPDRDSEVLVQRSDRIIEPHVLQKVRFRNLLDQKADYLIITHPRLKKPAANYGDPVTAYAAYRASPAGGSYDTLTVTVHELYDQFSFGEKSPLGIRKFLEAYHPRHQPDYLLLVGRAYGIINSRRQGGVTYFYRNNPDLFNFQELVPAYGYPYSDNQYSVGLDPGAPLHQSIAIGRIPARTPDDVGHYLDKVKEKDALGVQEEWQKNIMHLSGGRSAFELERFYNFLNGFKNVAEDIYLGGNVHTIRKRSNESVELINVSEEVNEGVSLVTFFGHAAPSTTDIDIGFASVNEMGYRNKGKYPVLLLNGCDAGNAFGDAYTFGEDWIVTPDRGASIFMAHADIGIDVYLRRYSESFYAKAFADSTLIHQSLGKIKIEAEKLLYSRYGVSEVNQSHASQIIMLGDPAIRMFPADKADYAVRSEDVGLKGFGDEPLNSLLDSMELSVVVKNLGIVSLDSVDLQITRQLPDGTVLPIETDLLAPVFRQDTVFVTVPNTGINSFGDNTFTVEINKDRRTEELNYGNNAVSVSIFVPMSGTLNLMPSEFSIVNDRMVEIIAQIPGSSIEERNVVIQLDTVPDFSSAVRRETRITTRNVAKWKVDLFQQFSMTDSMTYYWRTRFLEPREGENKEWNHSSFSFISDGPEGWTQRRLGQFQDNQLTHLQVDLINQKWTFQETQLNIDVFTFGTETDGLTVENTQIMLNGVSYILDTFNRFCPNGSLGLMAFQHQTLDPYLPVPLVTIDVLDERSCGRVPQVIQSIRNNRITNEGQTMLLDFVDGVKEGDYVVIFSVGNVTFSDWPDEAYLKLKELGANEATLRSLQTGDPYILFGRKGMDPGDAVEIVADKNADEATNAQVLRFETQIDGYFPQGRILTPRVGPATDWISFFSHVKENDVFNAEYSHFDIIGVTPDGGEVPLVSGLQEEQLNLNNFSAADYPYLRLRYVMDDMEASSPSFLDKWQVNYSGAPEGVLLMKTKDEYIELYEGEQAEVEFEFSNVSKYDFTDSLTVEYTFNNPGLRRLERSQIKIPPVEAGQSESFAVVFDSKGKGGKNSLNVFANPRLHLEQRYRNNIIDLSDYFMVNRDELNPVLDVHFDGVYIMDGDIVSPTVMISALVKDENRLSLKKDTTGMELMLKRNCEGCDFERVNFSSPKVKWFEATEDSDFKIELQPGPLEDGMYTLRINASDAAGNMAGEKPYEVNFEVINESQITNFYPYPNPFSSSVRFVFTVTGAEVPDEVKIQIMTVTGKVVREIFQDELGAIRIGNNISDYAWDGKDEFGDQLANGVYIYRVMVRKNGQFMEHRATAGDKAFKKGYGKMYLLR